MTPTSLEYMKLVAWLAHSRHDVILNKTQMQKILFMCYGLYLACTGKKLFNDDTPKAWPYGPVFPRVNKRYNPNLTPTDLSESEKKMFIENKDALGIIVKTVDKCYKLSAQYLTNWSHKEGSPWNITLYGEDGKNQNIEWNKVIDDDLIKSYFIKHND